MNAYKLLLPNSDNLNIWITSVLMILGLIFFNWRPEVIIFAYLFETIIIGVIQIIKMISVALFSENEKASPNKQAPWFVIPFFFFHFFFFIAIQMVFVFLFLDIDNLELSKSPFSILHNFIALFTMPDMQEAYLIIVLNNIFHTFKTFYTTGKYSESTISELFMQPYIRIYVQQFVAILGGFLFMLTAAPKLIAILLIGLKTFVDLLGVSLPKNPTLRESIIKFLFTTKGKALSQKEIDDINNFRKMLE